MANALESCSTNMAEKSDQRGWTCAKRLNPIGSSIGTMLTHLADRDAERMYGPMSTPTTTKRTSPLTKTTTTLAMSIDAPRDDEETLFATESVGGPSGSVATEAVHTQRHATPGPLSAGNHQLLHALAFSNFHLPFNLSFIVFFFVFRIIYLARDSSCADLVFFAQCVRCLIKLIPTAKSTDPCPTSPPMIRLHAPDVTISLLFSNTRGLAQAGV